VIIANKVNPVQEEAKYDRKIRVGALQLAIFVQERVDEGVCEVWRCERLICQRGVYKVLERLINLRARWYPA
jgi:hypothetical protein